MTLSGYEDSMTQPNKINHPLLHVAHRVSLIEYSGKCVLSTVFINLNLIFQYGDA